MVERIENLRKLLSSLSLPAEKAQEIINNEPLFFYINTRKFGFTCLIGTITNSASRKVFEYFEAFQEFGEVDIQDSGIARIVKIYGVTEDLEKIKEIVMTIKKTLKKERGI
ncbi:hypothetical protein V4D30_01105 [Thermodesulfovibrio sp. 3907-1M]|uniref:DUF1801 domain-containing protein n=1 Tax=Thermodesulfovibrio autotrophicus TaxID=3118333 RepID=A0AAU8GWN9_9BACT